MRLAGLLLIIVSVGFVTAQGIDTKKPVLVPDAKAPAVKPLPPVVQPPMQPAPQPGKVQTGAPPKLPKPLPEPPKDHKPPPDAKNGRWFWHQNHGYVFLAVNAHPVLVLPPTFVLPPQVAYYHWQQAPVLAPSPATFLCPHCGRACIVMPTN